MLIISVVGARPNFMKMAPVIDALKEFQIENKLVHTGQHYDWNMSKSFLKDLGLPEPDKYLKIGSGNYGDQTGRIIIEFEKYCLETCPPDLVIVAGDVNSTLGCSLVASKLGIKIAHIESGLRSFDRSMPEEINRLITDQISIYFLSLKKAEKLI